MMIPMRVKMFDGQEEGGGKWSNIPAHPISFFATSRCQGMDALFEDEKVLAESAIPRRQMEFATGRWCARMAMRKLGIPMVSIPKGEGREPVWPQGVRGSISHSGGLVCACVSRVGLGLGLDVEDLGRTMSDPVVESVCSKDELKGVMAATGLGREPACIAIFSAKESFYKAIYPEVRRFIPFESAFVRFTSGRGHFQTEVDFSSPESISKKYHGMASIAGSHILTWIHW